MKGLLEKLRASSGEEGWSAGVLLARDPSAIRLDEVSATEVQAAVRVKGRALPFEVFLWPDEGDWQCDCASRAQVCAHVVAAAVRASQAASGEPADTPASRSPSRPRVRVSLTRLPGGNLGLEFQRTSSDGATFGPLRGSIASSGVWARAGDLEVEAALATGLSPDPRRGVARELWPRILKGLVDASEITLDGAPAHVSLEARGEGIRVDDDGEGFRLSLVADPRAEEVFSCGVLRCGDTLHPHGRDRLRPEQRRTLQGGLRYGPEEVGRLVGETLPALRALVPVEIRTSRLPEGHIIRPELRLSLRRGEENTLELLPILGYGDPPWARVEGGRLRLLGGKVPIRDVETERRCERQCNDLFGMAPGRVRVLEAGEAIAFVRNGLGGFRGIVEGRELADAFKLRERPLRPRLRVAEGRGGLYRVEVDTDGASPEALLGAWERGESLVPLLDGGFAPLPRAWLEANGWRLAELLASRNEAGEVAAHTAPSLAAFAEDSGEPLPPSLDALRRMLEGLDTLPTRELPAGLRAELRPYQRRGLDWLLFLRDAGLGGVLADDMGLGKTLQALCAIASGPGPSLVVAPTSVIRNWMHEAARFLPHLRCCLYHGPERRIDEGADLVITSYALLRRDAERLASKAWAWAVLDEAQNIKNPDSQVARAARGLAARHRLALSGTPIENRLEELWSILGFVLPGFLGERRSFSERVSASLASADRASALAWLRQRVRPFILRRLKRDVEPDLPPRTDIVWRCEMAEAQRALYDSVRHTTLGELRRALGQGRILGALEALLRLRQAACHPALLPGVEMKDSVKVEVLMDALPQLVAEGHRALVFSQWTGFLDLLEPELQASALEYCRLDGSTRDRASVVERFQSEAGPPIFLISLKAGGMGLNLTAADYVFHLDPWWNPAVEDQAVDRAHRIGQRRPVLSVRLVAADTVEERILALQESKRGLADAMLSGEESLLRGLSREELLALFEA